MSRLVLELKTQNVSDPTDVIADALAIAKKFNIFVDLEIDYQAYTDNWDYKNGPPIENYKYRVELHPGEDTISEVARRFKLGVEEHKKRCLRTLQMDINGLEKKLEQMKEKFLIILN